MKKIKHNILLILLFIFKWHLRIIYFFIKMLTFRKKRVFFISRQSDKTPDNYKILINELEKENINSIVICKKVPTGLNTMLRNEKKSINIMSEIFKIFGYYFNMYKQMYYISTSKVVITDGYNITVSILNHKKGTKVIQLWHSLAAIKKFGYQTIGYPDGLNSSIAKMLCMHKNYDYVISGSKAMNKSFAEAFNVDVKKVLDIGTPTIDSLLKPNNKVVKEIYNEYPALKKKINLLYAPTFRSDGRNNVDELIKNIDSNKYNLIVSLHPKDITKKSDQIICIDRNKYTTFDFIRVCDYVITDYSAVAVDASVLNKRVILYVYDYEKYNKENGLNIDLFKELPGCTFKSAKDMMNMLNENKYNNEAFQKFRKKYVTNLNGGCTKKLIKLIKENL